ncbi:MAG TPA: signal peptidase I, partial [Mycobacterium sp.]
MPKALHRIGDVALWLGALIGACCLILTLAGLVFGVHPLIFRSGSMSPTINAGSLGIAREVPAAKITGGDIISVPAQGSRVTHRVVSIRIVDGEAELRLKGDANQQPDDETYRVEAADRLWFAIPGVGFAVAWLSRPPGVFVLALYAAVMIAVMLRKPVAGSGSDDHPTDADSAAARHAVDHPQPRLERRVSDQLDDAGDRSPRPGDHGTSTARASRPPAIRLVGAALGTALLVTARMSAAPTWAAYTDKVPVAGSTVGSYTVPVTTVSCGLLGIGSVTFSWTAVTGATGYTLRYGPNGTATATTTSTSYQVTTTVNNGTAWVQVNRGFGSTTWTSARSNTRTYSIALGLLG